MSHNIIVSLLLAVDKAVKYTNTKELPASWKRDEILGTPEKVKKVEAAVSPLPVAASTSRVAQDSNEESSSVSHSHTERK